MAKWIKCDPVTRANCPDRKTCGQPGEDVMFLDGSDCDKFSQKVRTAQTIMPAECKWMQDEICVNADCPLCCDYCPVVDVAGVCRFEDREDGGADNA